MHRPARLLLVQPAIQMVLAVLGFLLLGWPILQIAGERGTATLFLYVFVAWTVLIAVLAAVGACIARTNTVATSKRAPGAGDRR